METLKSAEPCKVETPTKQKGINVALSKKEIGRLGEDLALEYLKDLGWTILHQNLTYRGSEIDIVALDKDVVVFVEVRTRTTESRGSALESITPEKLTSIRRGLVKWLTSQEEYYKARIDVVSVLIKNGKATLTLTRNIG